MRQKGKMKQSDIAKFYGVYPCEVSMAFQKANLKPIHWHLETAWKCLYDLYMERYDNAIAQAYKFKEKANEFEAKWEANKAGIMMDKKVLCADCVYFNWSKQDKPCCYCVDGSMFEECEE